ncbi:acetyl-CoA synthetase-like protein [Leucogyrophana mollusca]|uniref:Acetyl-CoA synthetase-like protein n=1 Tax=Leucogyrophana mollusca TaxID=85980 RepID=A0ACB8BZM8_9AGAM|nr:acetyl-CoA synthetase-like protein [Leucogyrophana mollusca]
MLSFSSHLTVLSQSASLYSSAPVFRVPRSDPSTSQVQDWFSITYRQFKHDVELTARYWRRVLRGDGVSEGSVVGLWLGGMTYQDVLHIYGLSRAGYIPQLFSIRLPNPVVVLELLQKADAKALIFDSSFQSIISQFPLPTHLAGNLEDMEVSSEPLPPMPAVNDGGRTAFVFHTSGSTSGSPKLVPCSYRWLDSIVTKARTVSAPLDKQRQDVSVWMGSMCHIAQTFMLIGALQHGSCVIQPTKIAFSSQELVDMIHRCHLNRLNQFSTFLSTHLRNSREDPKLLGLLQSLDQILFTGLPLGREDEDWAYRNGLKLRNLFGSTECGATLISVGGSGRDAPLLRPIPGVSYGFFPIDSAAQTENHQSSSRLLELVILSESGDCPAPALRSSDGHFHTGDLFQEITSGSFVFRGRNDDWIKSENSLRCDTKAIEDNVRATCGHLIEECIVVGSGRPSPALFIEPVAGVDHDKLKREIIRKTRPFHARRYLHERITSPDLIVIVPPKSLPRTATKGNVRRGAVEEAYRSELDRLYRAVHQ